GLLSFPLFLPLSHPCPEGTVRSGRSLVLCLGRVADTPQSQGVRNTAVAVGLAGGGRFLHQSGGAKPAVRVADVEESFVQGLLGVVDEAAEGIRPAEVAQQSFLLF